jgi:hypothetical protein
MCDFYLWGYLKSRIYKGKPQTLEELKDAIHQQLGMTNQELLKRVEVNFREQLQIYIHQNSHHLSDIIFVHKQPKIACNSASFCDKKLIIH